MVSGTDYERRYKQAQSAYIQGDLETATKIADSMAQDYPEDPSILLLQGHICLHQRQYEVAKEKYKAVIELSDHQDVISFAHQGLEQIFQQEEEESKFGDFESSEEENLELDEQELVETENEGDWTDRISFDSIGWEPDELEDEALESPTLRQKPPLEYNFSGDRPSPSQVEGEEPSSSQFEDVFDETNQEWENTLRQNGEEFSGQEREPKQKYNLDDLGINLDEGEIDYDRFDDNYEEDFDADELPENAAPTFVVSSEPNLVSSDSILDESGLDDLAKMLTMSSTEIIDEFEGEEDSSRLEALDLEDSEAERTKSIDRDEGEELSGSDEDNFVFLPDELPDDLEDIGEIGAGELPISGIFRQESSEDLSDLDIAKNVTNIGIDENELAAISSIYELSPTTPSIVIKPEVDVSQGPLAKFFNFSLGTKQLISAGATGTISFLAVFIISMFMKAEINQEDSAQKVPYPWTARSLLSLVAGVTGGLTTLGMGQLFANHIKRYTADLQTQFESIYQGNYKVKATVYSQDELGQLAAGFNQTIKMIKTTTAEAKKRAEETERAREDLQRQVIRLLDDVEGAARGDLTVQAEVTADVLGAVADAFNLTITNLREIVKQVKKAAVQVNKSSTDSELFARNQSSDALRMAEELAVTLNSVQMMTDSIQRVAENAREAEEVARSSSVTALKGGDAVERTVAGILQIRETVSETTRKVKRLAEASQQISTIVAVISQISSRTNLLALNASIQAARAGEAGRGFAIVADEVRQLADRSAKSLQEIEQIVLQIQTETGSVMSAMEEGIQQVLDVTERSEQAKRSLEDIIQVSNRIDALVRSITADTVEQRENSRAVAKVMQAVELTAQATSQESQRVAGSLQNLVSISRDLLASVERFKVGADQNEPR
jgi:twitching motility protein PilJ